MGLLIITARIGEVAYCLDLKGWFTRIHPIFHATLLRRFVADGDRIEPPEPSRLKTPKSIR